ncbi:MAG TPA: acyl-CoA dehydrogenase family protein [Reyranella sp.]|nr:acyl-CoA dehydrogenase family protein [Reyranella sp.]
MIDFELSEEQRALRDTVHEFARDVIRPAAAEYDENEETPWPIMRQAHSLGLDTYAYAEEYGGGGVTDPVTQMIVTEEMAWGCAGIATAINATSLCATAIQQVGTPEQKAKYMPTFCDPNQVVLGAMGLTEAEAGSDVAALKTSAKRVEGGYLLNGSKRFISNGGIADVHVIFATTDAAAGWAGIQAFVVDKGNPGLKMGRKERKMGVRASHTGEVMLEDCFVPEEGLLGGERGRGGIGVLKTLESTRPAVGAAAVGIARAALEYALEYALQRKTFGRPIAGHQAIAFKLADMATEVEAARLLIWKAAWLAGQGQPFAKAASMGKLKAGDIAMRVTEDAIQILGGYGYIRDFPVEKWHRDAKIYQIWEGTAEIQRLVIARELTGRAL